MSWRRRALSLVAVRCEARPDSSREAAPRDESVDSGSVPETVISYNSSTFSAWDGVVSSDRSTASGTIFCSLIMEMSHAHYSAAGSVTKPIRVMPALVATDITLATWS